jgi:hypothetical protein
MLAAGNWLKATAQLKPKNEVVCADATVAPPTAKMADAASVLTAIIVFIRLLLSAAEQPPSCGENGQHGCAAARESS